MVFLSCVASKYILINNGKLLRRGNHETRFIGTELVNFRWQNIYYPIGYAFKLSLDEM
ncbi:hypothetical protein ACP6PL_17010 [Dapis sp. BLCC M126]|uniref:hypothetical protein n=1 Tax=Dapis sp. BLCC M126 TaxID=3400189 RepID=UPI003CF44A85